MEKSDIAAQAKEEIGNSESMEIPSFKRGGKYLGDYEIAEEAVESVFEALPELYGQDPDLFPFKDDVDAHEPGEVYVQLEEVGVNNIELFVEIVVKKNPWAGNGPLIYRGTSRRSIEKLHELEEDSEPFFSPTYQHRVSEGYEER